MSKNRNRSAAGLFSAKRDNRKYPLVQIINAHYVRCAQMYPCEMDHFSDLIERDLIAVPNNVDLISNVYEVISNLVEM